MVNWSPCVTARLNMGRLKRAVLTTEIGTGFSADQVAMVKMPLVDQMMVNVPSVTDCAPPK
jgi:hypothetical protein